ncbi:MAG TPA: hypothetical protein VHW71_18385 [Steroidobacteraceae bacterium]|jgi:hypothetical protein|nr:hypothetical protein [Steroidobacteraceae bacterium]
MILALAAALAIVVQDHAALRAAPRSNATELTRLWQGDVLEVRGEHAGYLKVYDHRRERAGYLRADAARQVELSETAAPGLLAVLRFLRDTPGSEALGISYGAAFLKAVPPRAIGAEPLDAIAQMAERLADQASGSSEHLANFAAHLEVVEQFGVRMHNFEHNGRMRVCYDGELFHRLLTLPGSQPEARAHAVLGLTRPDCVDPDLGPVARSAVDTGRAQLLEQVKDDEVDPMTRSRLHARRAGVWASLAFEQARRREPAGAAAERALEELLAVHPDDLGEDRRAEYADAVLRVSAVRWAGAFAAPQSGPLTLSAAPGEPGQTCIALLDARRPRQGAMMRRCTYGVVGMASVRAILQGPALVLAVQPLESWRELWVFHERAGSWTIDVLSPGLDSPEQGYVEFAGYAPGSRRLLIVREVKDRGRFRRSFEELRLDDLAVVRQASSPDLLRDFGRWQDITWRRDTLALH